MGWLINKPTTFMWLVVGQLIKKPTTFMWLFGLCRGIFHFVLGGRQQISEKARLDIQKGRSITEILSMRSRAALKNVRIRTSSYLRFMVCEYSLTVGIVCERLLLSNDPNFMSGLNVVTALPHRFHRRFASGFWVGF